jgi:phage regulator Rha-like protein
MLDYDLAALYEVPTKVSNQAVKRNPRKFPPDFMFRLTSEEWEVMRSQIVTASSGIVIMQSQIVTAYQNKRNTRVTPYAFIEQGLAMLSGVLNSDRAIDVHIAIMRAFIEIKKIVLRQNDIKEQMREIKERLSEHDAQLNQIYDAMENLLDEKAAQRKWEDRERIGFKK